MLTKNIYIRTVSLGNRKSCPTCLRKLNGNLIYSAGEYINAKWNNIQYFCNFCFEDTLKRECYYFKRNSGKEINFIGYQNTKIPDWLCI